jgi:hypothetical protein
MSNLQVDPTTGEILSQNIMIKSEITPAIILDINDVDLYYFDPDKLIDKINSQAGFPVFDINSKKGRKECASHSANIIRCIAPIAVKSKEKAADAKKIVSQDVSFRKYTEERIREIAEFHRKPLTEYEEEQEELKQELIRRENRRIEAEKLLQDHHDAIDLNELYTLRKARELAEQIAEAERKAIEDKRLFDEAVIEQAEKMEQERAVIREEEAENSRVNYAKRKADVEFNAKMTKIRNELAAEHGVAVMGTCNDYHDRNMPINGPISFYADDIEIEPTVFKTDVEMVTIPKSEYDELKNRSERLFELETEFA